MSYTMSVHFQFPFSVLICSFDFVFVKAVLKKKKLAHIPCLTHSGSVLIMISFWGCSSGNNLTGHTNLTESM